MIVSAIGLLSSGCGSEGELRNIRLAEREKELRNRVINWPQDLSKYEGKIVCLEGTAINAKLGAILKCDDSMIWIDGVNSWPDSFYWGQDKGKRVRVSGTVIRRDDVPVIVQRPGEKIMMQGVTVESEAEAEKVKWRYLLKDAKWEIVEANP